MKIVSYNVNGIRASIKLGLLEWLEKYNADVYCIQEVRCNETLTSELIFPQNNQTSLFDNPTQSNLKNYTPIYNCGFKPGYAGTLILTKKKPKKIIYDMEEFWHDDEGRTTTIIFDGLAIVNSYIPNGNSRLDFKMKYIEALTNYISELKERFDVILVGDFNIAHNEIDISHPKQCKNKSVFLPIEREAFSNLLSIGVNDCFRTLNPKEVKYTWRSYRSRLDENYNSWKYRIDYILVSNSLISNIKECDILELPCSDHLPVMCQVDK